MEERDVSNRFDELQQKYTALLKEHDQLKQLFDTPNARIKLAIFDRLPMPIWACDRNCRIVFWNDGAARLYGYSAEEAIGQDFVDLFVNKPEREKARIDCVDIIDNDKPIKNMADDIDKHGNTRKLVTQCFAVYNVEDHSGLQVEISYEVQDIDRLRDELVRMQEAYARAQQEREELQHKLIDVTRTRALEALDSIVASVKDSLHDRKSAADQAELSKDANQEMIAKVRLQIKQERDRLIKWEREKRKEIMSFTSAEDLESAIVAVEGTEAFDV
jgi:PAS domain S-box-containing protein